MYIEGINPSTVYVASLDDPIPFAVGTRGRDQNGREYVFSSIVTGLTAGDLVMLPIVSAAGVAIPLTTAAALYNRQVGVTVATFVAAAAGTGFWACVQGAIGARAATAILVNIPVYTSATAGAADDTAAAHNLIRGLTFTTAPSGAGVFTALVNYPTVGTVADTDNNT